MVYSANKDYGYATDSRLNDALSAIMVTSSGIGEILGPLCGGIFVNFFGFEYVSVVLGFAFLAYGVFYLYNSGYFSDLLANDQSLSDPEVPLKQPE